MKSAFFKNIHMFKLTADLDIDELGAALERFRHKPLGQYETASTGWVPPVPKFDQHNLTYTYEGRTLIALRTETKAVPTAAVKQKAAVKAQEVERQQGYKPGRKQMREIVEDVRDELLAKAPSVYRDTLVLIDPEAELLLVDSGTSSRVDAVTMALARTLSGTMEDLPVEHIYVESSPTAMMTQWLIDDEPPANFSIDQDVTLQNQASGKIKYTKLSIDADDAAKHIGQGKQCTRLAMTWADRISFVLCENMVLKSIKPLDVLRENAGSDFQDEQEQFESDFYLFGSEIAKLLGNLIEAHGGEKL